jgi:hypothetical protein
MLRDPLLRSAGATCCAPSVTRTRPKRTAPATLRRTAGPRATVDGHKMIVASMVSRRLSRMSAELVCSPLPGPVRYEPRTVGLRRFRYVDRPRSCRARP